jgi:hypothetical protein
MFFSTIYTREFEEMWSGAFHESKADHTPHLVEFDGTLVESDFSPTGLVTFEVWDELADADETIGDAIFFWTDERLSRQGVDRLQAGVEELFQPPFLGRRYRWENIDMSSAWQ